MKKTAALTLCAILIVSVAAPAFAGSVFETDFEEAAAEAKASNRYMLLDFTGSDWCGWCIKLDKEVFSRREFKLYAKKNLVCVEIDFPHGKTLRKALKEQNKALAEKYKVRGYPTILILSPSGDLVARTGYQEGGAEVYVEHLGKYIDAHREKNNIPQPADDEASKPETRKLLSAGSRLPKPLSRDENRELRTWTSKSGSTLTASVVEEQGPYVILKRDDGGSVKIQTSMLSDEDRAYIAGLKAGDAEQPEEL